MRSCREFLFADKILHETLLFLPFVSCRQKLSCLTLWKAVISRRKKLIHRNFKDELKAQIFFRWNYYTVQQRTSTSSAVLSFRHWNRIQKWNNSLRISNTALFLHYKSWTAFLLLSKEMRVLVRVFYVEGFPNIFNLNLKMTKPKIDRVKSRHRHRQNR